MLTSWIFSLILIFIVRRAVGRKPALIPGRGQAIVESLVEGMYEIFEPVVGKKMIKHTFPILIGFFVYILIQNWSGLFPGIGTLGRITEHGHLVAFFRPGNADLNSTLALALISFIAWGYFAFRYTGPKNLYLHLFGNKADPKGIPILIYGFLFFIFFGVGVIEVISILFRLVSLSFRLFGNVFGGESLIVSMEGVFKFALPVPFCFLECLIGLIQAFVFSLLVCVYIGLVCNHDEEEGHEH
ncbi:MAG: ATP synthase F0 subunit A [Verrucomicrobia bacterium GWC2_42_7]|nr:MAG: ATP synthase F0 subunit A [Verrucomicrobia bacterium GWC2_42_7]